MYESWINLRVMHAVCWQPHLIDRSQLSCNLKVFQQLKCPFQPKMKQECFRGQIKLLPSQIAMDTNRCLQVHIIK